MRKVIKDVIDPVVDRNRLDWENIFALDKEMQQHLHRIELLEKALFKTKQQTSIFDEIDNKFA